MNFQELVGSGNLLIGIPIALLAGLLSFASPCVLPLVPGYLGYVSGLAGRGDKPDRRRMLVGVSLFVLGFSVVFIAYMVAFGAIGWWLFQWEDLIIRILGVFVILMGLVFMGLFTWFQNIAKPAWNPATGPAGALLLGVVFAIGWTPCSGPILAMINAMSFSTGSAVQGGVLGFFYALGIGIPFIVIALGLGWATRAVGFLRRNIRAVNIFGGVLLVLIGIAMVSGLWSQLMAYLSAVMPGYVSPL